MYNVPPFYNTAPKHRLLWKIQLQHDSHCPFQGLIPKTIFGDCMSRSSKSNTSEIGWGVQIAPDFVVDLGKTPFRRQTCERKIPNVAGYQVSQGVINITPLCSAKFNWHPWKLSTRARAGHWSNAGLWMVLGTQLSGAHFTHLSKETLLFLKLNPLGLISFKPLSTKHDLNRRQRSVQGRVWQIKWLLVFKHQPSFFQVAFLSYNINYCPFILRSQLVIKTFYVLAYSIKITFTTVNVSIYNRIIHDTVSELTLSLLFYYFYILCSLHFLL